VLALCSGELLRFESDCFALLKSRPTPLLRRFFSVCVGSSTGLRVGLRISLLTSSDFSGTALALFGFGLMGEAAAVASLLAEAVVLVLVLMACLPPLSELPNILFNNPP
jgi:hypothetical protein